MQRRGSNETTFIIIIIKISDRYVTFIIINTRVSSFIMLMMLQYDDDGDVAAAGVAM